MTNGKLTVAEVIAEAQAARDQLAEMEKQLVKAIKAIDFTAKKEKRDRTAEELKDREEMNDALLGLREALKVLAFKTLQKLDSTAEVEALHKKMVQVNGMLADDLNKLKKIEAVAAIAAQVAEALAKGAEKLAAAAAKGAKFL